MKTIKISVRDKIAVNMSNIPYTCGNSDFVINFDFDAEWDEFSVKTARFIKDDRTYQDQVFQGNECPVPVLYNTNKIRVGVFAGDLHTSTPAIITANKGILCVGGSPETPSEDVYAQIMEMLKNGGGFSKVSKVSELENDVPFVSAIDRQTLTDAQKTQARKNIGAATVDIEYENIGSASFVMFDITDGNGNKHYFEWNRKPTDMSSGSGMVDLGKYGISNDGTKAAATTAGINQALADAINSGNTTVVFPHGTYLIAADSQIEIAGNLTVDFNHSTLIKEPNALEGYTMVEISGDHNVVKNATLYGDRDEHDYSSGGTHEWGIGIKIAADSRFTIIENVDIFDTTGYGINTSTEHNQIEPVRNRPLEAGCYDKTTGNLVDSTTHTVLGYTLDITDSGIKNDMFILGGNGYCAHGISEPLTFYMSFYDENETYIGFSRGHRLYDTIDINSFKHWYPTLRYIKFSLENTDTETNVTLELRSSYTSDDITIKNCEIARCRTLGIAITGGKRILVENVSIHDIGGAAPGYGVDIEDGYQLNQYIVFRSCEFYNNKYGDIVVVKTRDVSIENCRFQGLQRSLSTTDAAPIAVGFDTESVTSKFEVRGSVFTGSGVLGKGNFHNCIFLQCYPLSGNFTECRFYGAQFQNTLGTTLTRCYLDGGVFLFRNGNFACYDSIIENVQTWTDQNWNEGNPAEQWIMEGCLLKNCQGVTVKTGAKYIRLANNIMQLASDLGNCFKIATKQKTRLELVGNTFEQGGRAAVIILDDTYGSDISLTGNTFKSLLTSAESIINTNRVRCSSTGTVSFDGNTFDIAGLVASIPVLAVENCSKATLTNNRFKGSYGVPIKMTSVTEALCDGNDYTGTPVFPDTRTGVDIPDTCGKDYVDGLIGDISTVIANINSLVGGA